MQFKVTTNQVVGDDRLILTIEAEKCNCSDGELTFHKKVSSGEGQEDSMDEVARVAKGTWIVVKRETEESCRRQAALASLLG